MNSNSISASRPGCGLECTCVIVRGSIGDFLSDPSYQSGSWIIEVETETGIENHTVNWDSGRSMWDYIGVTYEAI